MTERDTAAVAQRRQGHLDLPQGIALYVGAVLGTGVLLLPALAYRRAGPASLVAWAALILLSVPLAATFASLAARYPNAGGVSHFVRIAFGRRAAACTGWWFYFGVMAAAPSAALIGGLYIADLLGAGYRTAVGAALVMLAVTFTMNALGVRPSARLQLLSSGLLAVLMVLAIVVSTPHAQATNLTPFAPHGWVAVGQAATILTFSFVGWEAVTHLSAEFRDPGRDVPRATAYAIVVVGLLYLGLALACVAVLGDRNEDTNVPVSDLMAFGLGRGASVATAVVAALLTIGTTNAYVGGAAKLGAALAREGALPGVLAAGSEAGGTARRSLALVGSVALVVLLAIGATETSIEVPLYASSACFIAVYIAGCLGAVRMLRHSTLARVSAWLSLALVVGLGIFASWYVLAPCAVAFACLLYVSKERPTRTSADVGV